jgi:hypothetical protein
VALVIPMARPARPIASQLGRYAHTRRLRVLREELADAIKSQNFALASRLKAERDELDPERALRARLACAVAAQDFAAASQLRDALRAMQRSGGLRDRLLFLSPEGTRMWVRSAELLLDEMPEPSGGGPVLLQPDDLQPGSYRLQQPTWSPMCSQVAATLIVPGVVAGDLILFDGFRGKQVARVRLPTAPFYYMWSTDERYVTCLGASEGRLVLLAVEVRTGEVLTLARGSPLFYSLAGQVGDTRLIAHNGAANALQLLSDYTSAAAEAAASAAAAAAGGGGRDVDASAPQPKRSSVDIQAWRTVSAPAGGFQCPWWSRWRAPDGGTREAIVFVERSKLVCIDAAEANLGQSSHRRVLYDSSRTKAQWQSSTDPAATQALASSFLIFVIARGAQTAALLCDPSETEILLLTPSASADQPCLLDARARVAPRADPVDLQGGLPRGERLAAVGAFWFSPGSRWLLVLSRTQRLEAPGSTASAQWRWIVYDCEERRPFGATPGSELSPALAQQYVPFFTQYAQSVSPFSPDGGAFCYVTDEGGFVATLHPERSELAARITITPLPNKPARPEVMWWSGPVTDAIDDIEMDLDDRRW